MAMGKNSHSPNKEKGIASQSSAHGVQKVNIHYNRYLQHGKHLLSILHGQW